MIEFIAGAAVGATVVVAKDILSDKSKGNGIRISQINEEEEQIEKLLKRNRELERQVEDLLASNKKMYSELSHSKDDMDNLQDRRDGFAQQRRHVRRKRLYGHFRPADSAGHYERRIWRLGRKQPAVRDPRAGTGGF